MLLLPRSGGENRGLKEIEVRFLFDLVILFLKIAFGQMKKKDMDISGAFVYFYFESNKNPPAEYN